jgi:hypothetical protein
MVCLRVTTSTAFAYPIDAPVQIMCCVGTYLGWDEQPEHHELLDSCLQIVVIGLLDIHLVVGSLLVLAVIGLPDSLLVLAVIELPDSRLVVGSLLVLAVIGLLDSLLVLAVIELPDIRPVVGSLLVLAVIGLPDIRPVVGSLLLLAAIELLDSHLVVGSPLQMAVIEYLDSHRQLAVTEHPGSLHLVEDTQSAIDMLLLLRRTERGLVGDRRSATEP